MSLYITVLYNYITVSGMHCFDLFFEKLDYVYIMYICFSDRKKYF